MTDVSQMSDADLMSAIGSAQAPDVGAMVQAEAQRQGVDPALALAVAHRESGLNADVKPSAAGAIGPMQLMPATARDLGVDPSDPEQNVRGGVAYLKQQLDRFGDPRLAVAAYNAGPGAVQKAGGVPNFPETQAYVQDVMGNAGVSGMSDADLMKAVGAPGVAAAPQPQAAGAQPAGPAADAIPSSVPYVLNQKTGQRYNDAQEATLRRMLMNGGLPGGIYGEVPGSTPNPGDTYVALDGTVKHAPPLTGAQQSADVAKSFGAGTARALAGIEDAVLSATPIGPVSGMLRTAAALGSGAIPQTQPFQAATSALDPMLHKPQTAVGRYAETIGEMLPNAATPGGVLRRVASVVAPAIGSQAAGDLAGALGASDPVRAVARFLGATAGGLSSGLRVTPGEQVPTPVSVDDLRAAKTAAYQAAETSGATIPKQAAQQMVANISQLVDAKGGAALYPTAAKMVDRLKTLVSSGITPSQLDDFRGQVYEQLMSDGGKEANIGGQIRSQLDGLLNSDAGDPNWAAARELNARYMKSKAISDRLDSAGLRSSSTYSGGNYANAVRQQMRPLVDPTSGALIRNLTPDEESAIRRIVNGTPAQNAMRKASKIANNKFVQTGLMLATPHGVGYPVAEAAGSGLRRISDAQTERAVQGLLDLMSTGGKATPQGGLAFDPGVLDPFNVGTVLSTTRQPLAPSSAQPRLGMIGAAYH